MKQFTVRSPLGALGEKIAKKYLEERGFCIEAENFYQSKGKRFGEIDIVASKNQELYCIEVKTLQAKQIAPVFPEQAVTRQKLSKMQKTAQIFVADTKQKEKILHFCVLAVVYDSGSKTAKVRFFEDVFY